MHHINTVGGCGAGAWTKVIGWFQIIVYGLIILVAAFTLGVMIATYDIAKDANVIQGAVEETSPVPGDSSKALSVLDYLAMMGIILTTLAFSIVGFGMTIVLIHGCYTERPKLLGYWAAYSYFALALGLLLLIADCFDPKTSNRNIAVDVLLMIVGVHVQGFSIWVVRIHKGDLEQRCGDLESVVLGTAGHSF